MIGYFYDQYVAFGEETTWATGATPNKFLRYHEGSFLEHVVQQDPHTPLAYADPERFFRKVEKGQGTLILPLSYEGLEKFYKHALGAVVTTGTSTPYTHTFNLADGPPFGVGAVTNAVGLTVNMNMALPDSSAEAMKLTGGMVSSAKFNFAVGEEPRVEFGLIGQKVVQGAKTATPTYPDLDTYLVKPSQVTLTVDGSTTAGYEASASSVDFTLDNGLDDSAIALGSAYIAQPLRGSDFRSITGTIKRWWDTASTPTSKAVYDKFISGATGSLVITCTGPSGRLLTVTISKIVYTGQTPKPQKGGRLPYEIPFRALYNASPTALQIVATNSVSAV